MTRKLTSREVFETLAPADIPRSLSGVFNSDGSLCTRAPTGNTNFAVWAVLVSEASPPRGVEDLFKANVLAPEVTGKLLDFLKTKPGRWTGAFLRWTEPACKWFVPSSRQLDNWPSAAKLRRVWTSTLDEHLGIKVAKPAKTITPEQAGQLGLFNA